MAENNFSGLEGKNIALLVNPASVDKELKHLVDLIAESKEVHIKAIFGPQHGLYGQTQDNMIEWEGFSHPYFNCPVYSLYGETRKPLPHMLENIEAVLIDLPDVGSRYYTFLWTALFMMEACEEKKIKVIVLDRPNPVNGIDLEGPGLNKNFCSFVGLHPMIIRHGLTIGECLKLIHTELNLKTELEIVKMKDWHREMWYDETGLPWVFPSPNMPTLDTATVYPGGCLIEGTLLSEGRGTTRPFEIIGAPYIDPHILKKDLLEFNLKGVVFRPLYFEPTFQKHEKTLCGGVQLHITDRNLFRSVETFVAILLSIRKRYEKEKLWKYPPYEYEYEKFPFDILSGSSLLREQIDTGEKLENIRSSWQGDIENFKKRREEFLLY